MMSIDPAAKMPPLPSLTADLMGAQLVSDFIKQLPTQTCP
jgi:hypothetical protein